MSLSFPGHNGRTTVHLPPVIELAYRQVIWSLAGFALLACASGFENKFPRRSVPRLMSYARLSIEEVHDGLIDHSKSSLSSCVEKKKRMHYQHMPMRNTTITAIRKKSAATKVAARTQREQRELVPDNDRRSALDKALLVLEAVVARPRPVGLPDLSAELGLPRQTVHRILQQLAENGLLIRDPSRDRYMIGPRLSHLALSSLSSANQGAPVRAILTDLVAEIGETCNVGVLDGLEFIYLDRVECSWSLRVHLMPGSRVPAYCTSGGKVLLAHLDAPLRAGLLRSRTLEAHTGATMTSPSVLEAELEQVRARGFAMNDEEFTVGIVGAAVPILDASGRALGALAVHGPSPRLSISRARSYLPQLKIASEKLANVWNIGADSKN